MFKLDYYLPTHVVIFEKADFRLKINTIDDLFSLNEHNAHWDKFRKKIEYFC